MSPASYPSDLNPNLPDSPTAPPSEERGKPPDGIPGLADVLVADRVHLQMRWFSLRFVPMHHWSRDFWPLRQTQSFCLRLGLSSFKNFIKSSSSLRRKSSGCQSVLSTVWRNFNYAAHLISSREKQFYIMVLNLNKVLPLIIEYKWRPWNAIYEDMLTRSMWFDVSYWVGLLGRLPGRTMAVLESRSTIRSSIRSRRKSVLLSRGSTIC